MSESDRDERVRQRAYERYEERGHEEGGDVEDWLSAEEELFHGTGSSHPEKDQPASPNDEGAQGPPDDNHGKDDKINEAAEESFPASDAPAWRGGSAN